MVSLAGMTNHIDVYLAREFRKDIEQALEAWTKGREASKKICMAIVKYWKEENTKTIDDFQTPSLELDFLPKINEMLTRDVLKQLGEKDLVRTYKMMHYNMSVIKQWLDSHEDRRMLLDK